MSLIQYNMSHVFYPGSDKTENALVLRAMVDLLVNTNIIRLRRLAQHGRSVPTLYRSGVTYARSVWWEPIPELYQRQWGDCKSLASALIAEWTLRRVPCQPTFRWVENADGTLDFHILVQKGNTWEDPSAKLGMGREEVARFFAPGSW